MFKKVFVAGLILVAALSLIAVSVSAAPQWTPAMSLGASGDSMVKTPRICTASTGGFHAMYKITSSGPWRLYYRRYQAGVLSTPTLVHTLGFMGGSNDICEAGNGDIWLSWENWDESQLNPGEQIWAARSSNGGASWTKYAITNYYYNPGEGGQAKNPTITPYGPAGSPNVMSCTHRQPANYLYTSTWDGSSWTAHTSMGQWADNQYATEGVTRSPVDGSLYWIFGKETSKGNDDWELYYRRFNGSTWESPVQITDNTTKAFFCRPSLAISSSGQIMFVWDDTVRSYARWYTPGTGWSQQIILGGGPFASVTWIPGTGDFYAVYSRSDKNQIMGRRFSGGAWQAEQPVSIGLANGYSLEASVCADANGTIYCSWEWHGGANGPYAWYSILSETDVTPPTTPVVTDGGASTDQADRLYASWSSTDPETSIVEYQYSIGTSPGATDVVNWTSTGLQTSVLRLGLSLVPGATYYINVKAKNGSGLWSSVGSSNGIVCTSVANNITFRTPQAVSTATDIADSPCLRRSAEGGMHLVYRDNNGGLSRAAYRKYQDADWSATELVSSGLPGAWYPTVAEDAAGTLYCTFASSSAREGSDIYETVRSGAGWSTPVNLTNNLMMNYFPRLISGSGTEQVHLIASADKSTYNVKHAVRSGSTWSWSTVGSGTYATGRYGPPDVAMDQSGNLFAVWAGNYLKDIRFAKRTGTTWSSPVMIATIGENAYEPRIAVGPDGLAHVVFRGSGDPDPGIYYIRQTSPTTWSTPVVIASGIWMTLAADNYGRVHLVFPKTVASGQRAIFHKYFNGVAWSTEQQISANTLLGEIHPTVEVDSAGYVHVAWEDKSSGTQKIYYTSNIPADATAPSTPSVTDQGAYTTSATSLSASWSSADPETGITEYQYAIGTSAGDADVLGWTSAGTSTFITRSDLALSPGTEYFISVKAKNGAGMWSAVGSSDGITMVSSVKGSVAGARSMPDGSWIGMSSQVVSAAFNGFFYVEDANRTAGIRVVADDTVVVGQQVSFGGKLETIDGERQITATSLAKGTTGNIVPAPLGMTGKSLGGSSLEHSTGIPGEHGLYNIGLLVTVFGRVGATGSGWFEINDGSGVVKVYSPQPAASGSYVTVIGVSSVEGTQKVVRVRDLPNQVRTVSTP